MTTDLFLKFLFYSVPVVNWAVTIPCHSVGLRGGNICLNWCIEKVRMLKFTDGFIHFHVNQVNDRTLGARYQCLITIRQQTDTIYWIIYNSIYLRYRDLALSHRVYSDTSIGMTWVNDWLNCICSDILYTFTATYRKRIRCFLYFPYLNLPILRTTCTFLLSARPGHRVYFLAMSHERVYGFSCRRIVYGDSFISSSSQKFLTPVIQNSA